MPVSFDRRSKVLLALVVSMTLGAGLLMLLAPEPGAAPGDTAMVGQSSPPEPATAPAYLATDVEPIRWQRVVIHRLNETRRGDYHFVVDADGTIQSTEAWRKQLTPGGVAGQPTEINIGVADDQGGAETVTLEAGKTRFLTRQLIDKLGLSWGQVYLHSQLDQTPCPSKAFEQAWRNASAI
ncbi:MAG: hypothetical protein BIFFINMI_00484 [Phycisphaerae bacterium]|nr:hypothetical protein [Phycisphaerae bacterium]